ncbi:MAG TPA: bifunctional ADP-heptose synthase [Edaphocola sp.]|nr:bifunctional ADP-heptose synthase [Edaphocola sp.]
MTQLTQSEILNQIAQLKIIVIGDLMLDEYIYGQVERISPEAPVPILKITNRIARLGGAANVALNCKKMGAQVVVAGLVGQDDAGIKMQSMLKEHDIQTDLLYFSAERSTTVKSRVISRNQQMLRVDEETEAPLSVKEEHPFLDSVLKHLQIQKPDLLIFEDYNKGVLKENIIKRVLEHCKNVGILTAVDPKFENFLTYKGVDIFKPNLKEVENGLNLSSLNIDTESLHKVHSLLKNELNHKVTLITLSEHGMYFCDDQKEGIIPTEVRNLTDVSGAGDTVIAVAAMIYAITRDVEIMAQWSNIAGGIVCEEAGVVPVNKEKLIKILNKKN